MARILAKKADTGDLYPDNDWGPKAFRAPVASALTVMPPHEIKQLAPPPRQPSPRPNPEEAEATHVRDAGCPSPEVASVVHDTEWPFGARGTAAPGGAVVPGINGTVILYSGGNVVVARPIPTQPVLPNGDPGFDKSGRVETNSQPLVVYAGAVRNLQPPLSVEDSKSVDTGSVKHNDAPIMDEEFQAARTAIAAHWAKVTGMSLEAAIGRFDKLNADVIRNTGRLEKRLARARALLETRLKTIRLPSRGFSDIAEANNVAGALRYPVSALHKLEAEAGLPPTPVPQKVLDAEAMRSAHRRTEERKAKEAPNDPISMAKRVSWPKNLG